MFLQEQLEHAEVSTALRYLGQYYFKNKQYDEASLCAQRCCDYNDVSHLTASQSQDGAQRPITAGITTGLGG